MERMLRAEETVCAKTGLGDHFAHSEPSALLREMQAQAQEGLRKPRRSASRAQQAVPTLSPSPVRSQSCVSFPRLELVCFRWKCLKPQGPRLSPAWSHPGSLQAFPWSLLPLLGTCEERL